MKFLSFSDVHEQKKFVIELVERAKQPDIDFVICAGDFSSFGRGMKYVLRVFNDLGKTMYVIPGNHEDDNAFESIVGEYPHCVSVHKNAVKVGEYILCGYGGNGFVMEDSEFRKIAREWYGLYNGKKIIFVTHGPAYGTKIDLLNGNHVGNKDYRKFIERIKPKVAISGHLHETVGTVDKIGETQIANPGWEGMVIEVK